MARGGQAYFKQILHYPADLASDAQHSWILFEIYETDSAVFDSYRESEKQNILEGFPEEDREELASKDLDTLRFLKKKLGASDGKSIINNIPSISNSVRNNDMEISPLKHNSTRDEKNKWHKQMLDKFGNKGG